MRIIVTNLGNTITKEFQKEISEKNLKKTEDIKTNLSLSTNIKNKPNNQSLITKNSFNRRSKPSHSKSEIDTQNPLTFPPHR